jgi:hypothetical protein
MEIVAIVFNDTKFTGNIMNTKLDAKILPITNETVLHENDLVSAQQIIDGNECFCTWQVLGTEHDFFEGMIPLKEVARDGRALEKHSQVIISLSIEFIIENGFRVLVDKSNDHEYWPKTKEEAFEKLIPLLSEEALMEIASISLDDFLMEYCTIGSWIRNYFGLWRGNYQLLLDCDSENPEADNVSTVILSELWHFLNENKSEAINRIKVCDIIEMGVQYLSKLEKIYLDKFPLNELLHLMRNHDSDESNFEKALFTLAFIYKTFNRLKIDRTEFYSLVYSTVDIFSNSEIENKLKSSGITSKGKFISDRLKIYYREIKLLYELEQPHSGIITNFWYFDPLSLKENVDKNMVTLTFFLSMVFPDYFDLLQKELNEILQ